MHGVGLWLHCHKLVFLSSSLAHHFVNHFCEIHITHDILPCGAHVDK